MKLKSKKSSNQQQTSEQPWVDCPDGFCSPHQQAMLSSPSYEYSRVLQFSTGEVRYRRMAPDGYPLYIDANNDPYTYLKRPNPPTPEAIERAKFVDKTYRWNGR